MTRWRELVATLLIGSGVVLSHPSWVREPLFFDGVVGLGLLVTLLAEDFQVATRLVLVGLAAVEIGWGVVHGQVLESVLPLAALPLVMTGVWRSAATWYAVAAAALALAFTLATLDVYPPVGPLSSTLATTIKLPPTPIGSLATLFGSPPAHWMDATWWSPPDNSWTWGTPTPVGVPQRSALSVHAALAAAARLSPRPTWGAFVTGALVITKPNDTERRWRVPGGAVVVGTSPARAFVPRGGPPELLRGPQGSEVPAPGSVELTSYVLLAAADLTAAGGVGMPPTTTPTAVLAALSWARDHLMWAATVSPAPRPGETPAQFFSSWIGDGSCEWIATRVASILNDGPRPGAAQLATGFFVEHPGVVVKADGHAWLIVALGPSAYLTVDPTAWVREAPVAPARHASPPDPLALLPPVALLGLAGALASTSPRRRLHRLERRLAKRCEGQGLTPGVGACESARRLGDAAAHTRAVALTEKVWR